MTDLIADIGATNARFQLVEGGDRAGEIWVGETADYTNVEALLADAMGALTAQVDRGLFAVAGPVGEGGVIETTNTGLRFEPGVCARILDAPVRLVNDFQAIAYGVPCFEALVQIGGEDVVRERATRAVLGPGSGLGMATITPVGEHDWIVLSGEGGHADFSPTSHLETELWSVLSQQVQHVSWETVLSGAGIVNLYRATSMMWGAQPEDRTAEEISVAGATMTDPVCHQTMELFAGLLGCAAGNLALTVGAVGGVYVAGGIAPRLVEFLQKSPLRRRFEEKGVMAHFVEPIPLYIVTETQPGLIGAAACLNAGPVG